MLDMFDEEISMIRVEWVKGRLLGDVIREKEEVEFFGILGEYYILVFFKLFI